MKPSALCALLLLPACAWSQAVPESPPSARDLHSAQCVAALDLQTQELARQVKAGKEALRPVLLERLVAGATFVGDAYLHGDSEEGRARELADEAREAQKRLPPAELAARQAACASEGSRLHASGNALQKAVVKRLAKKRMERLLGA
jgi:hypothetical protein